MYVTRVKKHVNAFKDSSSADMFCSDHPASVSQQRPFTRRKRAHSSPELRLTGDLWDAHRWLPSNKGGSTNANKPPCQTTRRLGTGGRPGQVVTTGAKLSGKD